MRSFENFTGRFFLFTCDHGNSAKVFGNINAHLNIIGDNLFIRKRQGMKFKCSTVVIVMPLVLIMKDKVEELSNIGIKTFAIGTGDEEAIDEGATTGGESFGFCCPGEEPEFFAESTNALLFSLTSPMNIIALADILQSSGIISIKLPC